MEALKYLEELTERYPLLDHITDPLLTAFATIKGSYENGGKLLIAGNGGSCADSEHIVGELMKGFVKQRPVPDEFVKELKAAAPECWERLAAGLQGGLAALTLTGHPALSTAYLNDADGTMGFAQQLYVLGKREDVFLGISTSGNSANVLYAMLVAKAKGMKTIAMTGSEGGAISRVADVTVAVPENETYRIQELHLPVYHTLCLMLEEYFFTY